jgi:hypothetical protein
MGTGDPFSGAKARPGRNADHPPPHLVPRSRMGGSYNSCLRGLNPSRLIQVAEFLEELFTILDCSDINIFVSNSIYEETLSSASSES